jgi:hypothetical protein
LEQNKDCQNVEKSNIRIENVILQTVEVSKLIGVNIDCCLTWSNHLELLRSHINFVSIISTDLSVMSCEVSFAFIYLH